MLTPTQLALTEVPEGACVQRSAGGIEGKSQWLEAITSAAQSENDEQASPRLVGAQ